MRNIVVPISEARDVRWAVAQIVEQYREEPTHVYLLCVRHPLPLHISRFFKGGLKDFYRQAGMEVLQPAIAALDNAAFRTRTSS